MTLHGGAELSALWELHCLTGSPRPLMKTFRTWFTPGSLVLAMLVALLWLRQLHLMLALRVAAQLGLVALTYLGLWALASERSSRR